VNLALRLAILQSVRTQTRLAHVTGIPEWRLSKIVNGWQAPSSEEQRAICNALGAKRETLFAEHTNTSTPVGGV
jgi:hypothetical protein